MMGCGHNLRTKIMLDENFRTKILVATERVGL